MKSKLYLALLGTLITLCGCDQEAKNSSSEGMSSTNAVRQPSEPVPPPPLTNVPPATETNLSK